MIAASLGLDRFDQGDLLRFSRQIRAPRGETISTEAVGHALLVGSARSRFQGGWRVCFAGQLHNAAQIASDLDIATTVAGEIYAAALNKWGDQADERCIGHYATIALSPEDGSLRLARSPFQAPPLHFRSDGSVATVAQCPRLVFWRDSNRPTPDLERLAQMLVNDASDRFRSWYLGARRMPLGSAVSLRLDRWQEVWRYDLFAKAQVSLPRPSDYVEAARALLDDGVAAALVGSRQPAIMLSGGLDSPLVAASALQHLGPDRFLHSYTFGPDPAWAGGCPDGIIVNEFSRVKAFAAQHPRLATHFECNRDRDFRTGLRELLEACDAAPSMLGLAWIEHALHEAAAAHGCDVMLTGTWGNFTLSSRGPWAFSEYLLTGNWGQLARALRGTNVPPRSLWRQFASRALAPLLPRAIWRIARLATGHDDNLSLTAIRKDWPGLSSTLQRSRKAGYDLQRLQFRSKRDHWRSLLAEDGQEQDQYALGMRLVHGLALRDPTAYRPLVEFCWGCPSEVFLRDGTDRWLAREMARGVMPEAQRTDRAYAHHYVDWQPRFAAIRADLLAELELMSGDPDISSVIDLARLRKLVEAVPTKTEAYDARTALPFQITLPVGMAAARFVAYAKGRNDI